MRRSVLAILLAAVLALASCSSSGGSDDAGPDGNGGSDDTTTNGGGDEDGPDIEDPAAWVVDSVDATLAANSFEIDSELALLLDRTDLALTVNGPVDYEKLVADVEMEVDSGTASGTMAVRVDGETLWLAADGEGVPAMPGGSTWVEGPASLLEDAESFGSEGLLGTIYALRAAEEVEAHETQEAGGVTSTRFTTSFTYGEAVEASGPDRDAFTESFSLRGFDHAVIDVEVWIGDDGVIRSLTYALDESEPGRLTGSYDLTLTAVGEPVDQPDAPDAVDVTSGPEAESWLEANMA
jgi:hypothetical protein